MRMNLKEALEYCYKHENEFKSDVYALGEDGCRQFECLVGILESGTIQPSELADYGMDYEDDTN